MKKSKEVLGKMSKKLIICKEIQVFQAVNYLFNLAVADQLTEKVLAFKENIPYFV